MSRVWLPSSGTRACSHATAWPPWPSGTVSTRSRGAGNGRHDVAADHRLELLQHPRRTWRAAVVDRIPAVPTRTTCAHLRDPRPDPFGRRVNRDGVGGCKHRIGDHRVDTKSTTLLERRGNAGGERHDALDAAFAVPAVTA